MKKVLIKSIDKISKTAKKIAEESPNTVSTFLYYEPKAPKSIKK
ncbi:cyclic lactone autoinducer peptide [Tissierella pigra]|uniref:Cyclic lactone autoinducer peptide n=1 Tax=Tissierella pigra TaxID=2607614 RepID=A0A6N7XLL5_9FIRM|nr:cyclic lactone autoinducer peptide [Tissierella pigra]MBU5428235.1 cyclic lactone autoinducer peptide [Tissierella pigra]MSU02446.1 cyclic lactone autoinducer peptide [Tissierella pigra]